MRNFMRGFATGFGAEVVMGVLLYVFLQSQNALRPGTGTTYIAVMGSFALFFGVITGIGVITRKKI
ncbi:hypothetical protein H0W91_00915 [Patescibacteria group bacterium]|nr:hypothetical protein [Patescibacteria group bacterium]